MTQPTLFAGLNGDLTYRTPSGSGTFTASGPVAYGDGMVAGSQAYEAVSGSYLSVPSDGIISAQRGAVAMRLENIEITTSANQWVLAAGEYNVAGQDFIGLLTNNNDVWARFRSGTASPLTFPIGTMATGAPYTVYVDWDGTTVRGSVDTPVLTSSTRTDPIGSINTPLYLGTYINLVAMADSYIDELFVFDDIPTDTEREMLFDTERAWSSSMFARTAPRPSRVFVLGSPHNLGPFRVGRR